MTLPCARCGVATVNHGRGMCSRCYFLMHRLGRLAEFPRTTVALIDVVEEYRALRGYDGVGLPFQEIAQRMGLTEATAKHARWRATQRGLLHQEETSCPEN